MNENKSDTLSQRKKAQEEFLLLKKMQSGEIVPDSTPEHVVPLTFGEKIKNFWYHYKAQTILSLFLATALAICVTQCATKPNYDAEIVLYTNHAYSPEQIDLLTDYMKQFFADTNNDGEIHLVISDCSYTTDGTYDSNRTNTLATKLNATIASGVETQLYIVDEKKLEQLNKLAEKYGGFLIESTPMPEDLTAIVDAQGYTFPKGLIIGKRLLNGTTMENNETAKNASNVASQVIDNIKNYK